MAPDLKREHGRLVVRLRRQLDAIDRGGLTDERAAKVLRTIRDIIVVEREIEDPLLAMTLPPPGPEEVRARIARMKPGAGLEVVSR